MHLRAGRVLRHQAGGGGHRGVRRLAHRLAGAEEQACCGRWRRRPSSPSSRSTCPSRYIVLAAGILGFIGGKVAPDKFKVGGGHGASNKHYGPALIDDDTPPPEHAKFKLSRLIFMTGRPSSPSGAAAMLAAERGDRCCWTWASSSPRRRWSPSAAPTPCCPMSIRAASRHYSWLTGPQMIDGLALGETTPGPLIMVVAFVGFVGGWTKEIFGPDSLLLAGFAGACGGDLLHLPAVLPVHPGRRPAGGSHPRRPQVHRAADRHHRRRGGRDPQPGAVLRLARALAARPRRPRLSAASSGSSP